MPPSSTPSTAPARSAAGGRAALARPPNHYKTNETSTFSPSGPPRDHHAGRELPKTVPRGPKTASRAAKIAPRDSKIGPRGHSGPSRAPKSSPSGLQEVIQKSQEPSKTSKRGFWTSILQSFPTVFQEHVGFARDVYIQRAFQIRMSRPIIIWLQ